MSILGSGIQEGLLLKPVTYPWAMDLYDQAVANTWFPNEVQLGEDLADFERMSDDERHALTHLMSYFNPNELLVNKAQAAAPTGGGAPRRGFGAARTATPVVPETVQELEVVDGAACPIDPQERLNCESCQ